MKRNQHKNKIHENSRHDKCQNNVLRAHSISENYKNINQHLYQVYDDEGLDAIWIFLKEND
jgi:hypothetical protein